MDTQSGRPAPVRWLAAISTALVCLGLLAGLLLHHFDREATALTRASVACESFISVEAALRQAVLAARVGLTQSYDDTVHLSAAASQASATLRQSVLRALPEADGQAASIEAGVREQLDLVEQFKSRNAVLRNALAAFGILAADFDETGTQAPAGPTLRRLGMAILELTLNTAPAVAASVDGQLSAMEPLATRQPAALSAVMRHASIIRERLPAMDAGLRRLMAVPDDGDVGALRSAILAQQGVIQANASLYRTLASILSGLLLLMLVRLVFVLRSRAQDLRRRASLERSFADLAARLSDPVGLGGERLIARALASLGGIAGCDLASVSVGPDPVGTYDWSRGGPPQPGWASRVESHMRHADAGATQLHVTASRKATPAPDRALLAALGLSAVAASRKPGSGLVALGWRRGQAGIARSEMALLALALDFLIQAHVQFRLAQEHVRLEESLRKARRMETVGAFASGIAHNFNNILAAMLGHAELEELDRRDRGEDTQRLAALRAAGERGQDLVASILAVGRRDQAGPRPFDARAILLETVTQLRAAWPDSVALHVDAGEGRVPVLGSATQLQQALLNVCRNAAQAVPCQGDVWLSLQVADVQTRLPLSHGTVAAGRYARFGIRDTGTGMDRPTLRQIFKPFFSERPLGNGLGLSTAWDIVRDHDGLWNVVSAPGQGSEFEIWLPLCDRPLPDPDGAGRGEAVLVFNPDEASLLRDEEVVAAFGFEPVGFSDPAAATQACHDAPARFDVIVIAGERAPPGLTDLVGAFRACAPSVPILLAVGASSDMDLAALSAAGLSDIVGFGPLAGNLRHALAHWSPRCRSGQPLPA